MLTLALCGLLALLTSTAAIAQKQQHPYFPLTLGATWTYQYSAATIPNPDTRVLSSETHKVVNVSTADNTYTVEKTSRIGTLPSEKTRTFYEVRNGNVLDMRYEPISGPMTDMAKTLAAGGPNVPAPIVLKANLTKGMHWKSGPTTNSTNTITTRTCDVLDFVSVKVPAGEFHNVVKLRVTTTYHSDATGRGDSLTTFEYYAPNVGLIKTDLLEG